MSSDEENTACRKQAFLLRLVIWEPAKADVSTPSTLITIWCLCTSETKTEVMHACKTTISSAAHAEVYTKKIGPILLYLIYIFALSWLILDLTGMRTHQNFSQCQHNMISGTITSWFFSNVYRSSRLCVKGRTHFLWDTLKTKYVASWQLVRQTCCDSRSRPSVTSSVWHLTFAVIPLPMFHLFTRNNENEVFRSMYFQFVPWKVCFIFC